MKALKPEHSRISQKDWVWLTKAMAKPPQGNRNQYIYSTGTDCYSLDGARVHIVRNAFLKEGYYAKDGVEVVIDLAFPLSRLKKALDECYVPTPDGGLRATLNAEYKKQAISTANVIYIYEDWRGHRARFELTGGREALIMGILV